MLASLSLSAREPLHSVVCSTTPSGRDPGCNSEASHSHCMVCVWLIVSVYLSAGSVFLRVSMCVRTMSAVSVCIFKRE